MSAVFIHPSSVVEAGASVGPDTRIWHFCHVMPRAIIGARCSLGQNVFVANHAKIGDGCKLQNNVSVYEGVTLEPDVFCGPSVVFTNVRTPRAAFPRNSAAHFERTLVGRGASIGANATIRCGVTIGAHAMIGAGAVVTKDVAPYALVMGNPAKQRGWSCICGERLSLAGAGRLACPACKRVYQLEQGALSPEF